MVVQPQLVEPDARAWPDRLPTAQLAQLWAAGLVTERCVQVVPTVGVLITSMSVTKVAEVYSRMWLTVGRWRRSWRRAGVRRWSAA